MSHKVLSTRTVSLLKGVILLLALNSCTDKEPDQNFDWKDCSINANVDLQSISMVNELVGYTGGVVLTDKFETLQRQSLDPIILWNVNLMINPDTNLLDYKYKPVNPINPIAKLYKTTNGGLNWVPIETPFKSGVVKLQFVDEQIGFVTTKEEGVFKTTDGGQNWENILRPIIHIYKGSSEINPFSSLFFSNKDTGYVYGRYTVSDIVLRTHDGGHNWECLNLSYAGGVTGNQPSNFGRIIKSIVFPENSETGFVVTTSAIYKTIDNGVNWQKVYQSEWNISGAFFVDNQHGFIPTSMLKTTDGGVTWDYFNYDCGSLDPFYAVSETEFYRQEGNDIYFTKNDIHNEVKLSSQTDALIHEFAFPNKDLGIAVGANGKVLRYSKEPVHLEL